MEAESVDIKRGYADGLLIVKLQPRDQRQADS